MKLLNRNRVRRRKKKRRRRRRMRRIRTLTKINMGIFVHFMVSHLGVDWHNRIAFNIHVRTVHICIPAVRVKLLLL